MPVPLHAAFKPEEPVSHALDGSIRPRHSLWAMCLWAAGSVSCQGHNPHLLLLQLGGFWGERSSRLLRHLAPPRAQLEQHSLGLAVVVQLRSPGWQGIRCRRGEACMQSQSIVLQISGTSSALPSEQFMVSCCSSKH